MPLSVFHVPGLQQAAAGLVGYVHRQLELPIASTAPLAKITHAFITEGFARASGFPWVDFATGQAQGLTVRHQHLAGSSGHGEGVLFGLGVRRRSSGLAPY